MPTTHETSDIDTPPPAQLNVKPKTLALITFGGLVAGTLIVVGAIMPAEFNTDPLGVGKLSGISRLWAPEAKELGATSAATLAYSSTTPKSSHIVDIPLGAADWAEAAVEYKVAMTPGQSIFYKWSIQNLDGTPASVDVEVDQHGHDTPPEGQSETVVQYHKGRMTSDQGSITAPMSGIFGWYFRNHAADPIIVRVEIEGFYTLIPPGQPGNEFKLKPQEDAAPE